MKNISFLVVGFIKEFFFLPIEIHDLVNIERQNYGISQLRYDLWLEAIARAHSQDMANKNYFDHNNLKGQNPTDRAKAAGYPCYKDCGSYLIVSPLELLLSLIHF